MNKLSKKILSMILALVMVVTTFTVLPTQTEAASKGKVKSVTFSKPTSTNLVLAKGKTYQLKTKITVTKKNTNKKVSYTSSNKKIAKVSVKGKIKALKAGTTTITVKSKTNKKAKASIKVIVGGTRVKSVKVSKKSASLHQGETLALRATLKTSKATVKEIVWKSTKPSVATVGADGVVTAVKPGTTKIYAKSNDGSGKKAYCKVKVLAAVVSIQSMKVLSSDTIQFALSYPRAINSADIVMSYGTMSSDASKVGVKSLNTSDNQNYKLRIDSSWGYGDRVKMTIPSLNGTNVVEGQYLRTFSCKTVYQTGVVGKSLNTQISGSSVVEGYGDVKVTGGTFPAGIQYDASTQKYTGIYASTCENVVTTRTSTNPWGNTASSDIHWSVGSEKVLVSTNHPIELTQNDDSFGTDSIFVAGGSGSYSFELVDRLPSAGMIFYSYDDNFNFRGRCSDAGTFTVNVIARDVKDPTISITIPVTIQVVPGVTVSGLVKDINGNPDNNATISLKDVSNGKEAYTYTNDGGDYKVLVKPGRYFVTISSGGDRSEDFGEIDITGDMVINSILNGSNRVTMDFKMPAGASNAHSKVSLSVVRLSKEYTYYEYCNKLFYTYLSNGTYCLKVTLDAYDEFNSHVGTYTAVKYVSIAGEANITIAENEWVAKEPITSGLVRFTMEGIAGGIEQRSIIYVALDNANTSGTYSHSKRYNNGSYRFAIKAVMKDGHVYQAVKDVNVNGADVLVGVAANEWTFVE